MEINLKRNFGGMGFTTGEIIPGIEKLVNDSLEENKKKSCNGSCEVCSCK